ncbi:hypothetical protein JCM17960_13840 [Magnetospira thiophila]
MVLNRVALTGASGMVGRHVLAELSGRGISVAATSRSRPEWLPVDAAWTSWDLAEWRSPEALDAMFGPVHALLHVGAMVPTSGLVLQEGALLAANVSACRCLGNWAMSRDIPMMFLSGAVVYDFSVSLLPDETVRRTSTPEGGLYGLSKVLAEQVLENLAAAGLRVALLRATSIYGWGLPENKLLTRLLSQARDGETLNLQHPVEDQVNLVHASDVARAMVDVATSGQTGAFNIGGFMASLKDMAESCVAVAGAGQVLIEPGPAPRPAIHRFQVDGTRAAQAFGYRPRVMLREGLERLLAGRV